MDAYSDPNEKTRAPGTEPPQRIPDPGREDEPKNVDEDDDTRGQQTQQTPGRERQGNDRIEPGEEHATDRPAVKPSQAPSDLE